MIYQNEKVVLDALGVKRTDTYNVSITVEANASEKAPDADRFAHGLSLLINSMCKEKVTVKPL